MRAAHAWRGRAQKPCMQTAPPSPPTAPTQRTRVADQQVHRPPAPLPLAREAPHVAEAREVEARKLGAAAVRRRQARQLLGGARAALAAARRDDDVGATLGELACDGVADAGVAAGDDRGRAAQREGRVGCAAVGAAVQQRRQRRHPQRARGVLSQVGHALPCSQRHRSGYA